MKRIKVSFFISLLFLTGLSILVTNSILIMFWAGDILQRETLHLQRMLTAAVSDSSADATSLPISLQSLLTDIPAACVYWKGTHYEGDRSATLCRQGAEPLATLSLQTGTRYTSTNDFSLLDPRSFRYLRVFVPVAQTEHVRSVVGISVPMTDLFNALWEKERIIAVYLVFNTILLVSLTFLRLLKRYILPVDRMARAAETYSGDGFQVFIDRPTNELSQLATSIHGMVQRIELDKQTLNANVMELSEKNLLLQKNQREMVRAEKLASVGRLAAGFAHEIGNPIAVVQGYLQLIGMTDCNPEERIEFAEKALEELSRVDRLIRRLLDHARTGRGQLTNYDMHDLILEVTESLHVHPLFRGIHFDTQLKATTTTVYGENDKLRQVIVNCLLNSADAINSKWGNDSHSGTIQVITSDQGDPLLNTNHPSFVITITDNGCGIPQDMIDSVFDPFFTTKEPGAGTGLGLSVSQALIESAGGRILISSSQEEGTTVEILVPFVGKE